MTEMEGVKPEPPRLPAEDDHGAYSPYHNFVDDPTDEILDLYSLIPQVDQDKPLVDLQQQERDDFVRRFDRSLESLFEARSEQGVAAIAAFGAAEDPEKRQVAVRHLGTMARHAPESAISLWKRLLSPDSEVQEAAQAAIEPAREAGVLSVAQVVELQQLTERQ